ncbi:hypothetical protein ACI65C_013334 [Semiaphis heraclei]
MSDTEAEPAEQSTPPKKTKYYEQKYCPSWESKDKIKGWLSKSTKANESTDRSVIKHMALVARVVNSNFTTSDYFLSLIPIQSATAESLFNHIIEFLETNSIDYEKKYD